MSIKSDTHIAYVIKSLPMSEDVNNAVYKLMTGNMKLYSN